MGFEIKTLEPTATVHVVVAEERLWQTADKESLVPDGHEDAAFLYCVPGQQLPIEEAKRYGLVKTSKKKADDKAKDQTGEEPAPEEPASAQEAVDRIGKLETVEEAEAAVNAALEKWPDDEALLEIKARVDEIKAAGGDDESPTIAARIDAVASHAEANALGAELGVEFEAKKPNLEEKRKALREAAAKLAEGDAS